VKVDNRFDMEKSQKGQRKELFLLGILAVFEDTSDHRIRTRAYAFMSAVYVLSSAAWVSPRF